MHIRIIMIICRLGLLLYYESLVAYSIHDDRTLILNIMDILLLTHFISNSTSLKSTEHNWVPLCLPHFNSKAYLQVCIYIYKCVYIITYTFMLSYIYTCKYIYIYSYIHIFIHTYIFRHM